MTAPAPASAGDVSIGSIASSAGAEAERQRRMQSQLRNSSSAADGSVLVVVSPRSAESESEVAENAPAGDGADDAPSEWRNVPPVVARSIVRMDRTLSQLLALSQSAAAAAAAAAATTAMPAGAQRPLFRNVVHSAYSSERSGGGTSASSLSGGTPPPPLLPSGSGANSNAGARQTTDVRIPREAVIAQQQQVEAHARQATALAAARASLAAASSPPRAGLPLKQQQQQQGRVRRGSAASSVASSSYSAAVAAAERASVRLSQSSSSQQQPQAVVRFCVTTAHANSALAPLEDFSLFGMQGPRGLFHTDQRDGATFLEAHAPEFEQLAAQVALLRQQQQGPKQPQRRGSPRAPPATSGANGSPSEWKERIEAVRRRQQPAATQETRQSDSERAVPQTITSRDDDKVSVASSSCSAAVVLASRARTPDVLRAVAEVDTSNSSGGGATEQQDGDGAADLATTAATKPPLHPKPVPNRSAPAAQVAGTSKAGQLEERLLRLRGISQQFRRHAPATDDACVVAHPRCRWADCEEDGSGDLVRCGGRLMHRGVSPRRVQTCLDGVSAASSMYHVRQQQKRDEKEERTAAALEAEKQRQAAAEEQEQAAQREREERRRTAAQRVSAVERRIAAAWRAPPGAGAAAKGTDDGSSQDGDADGDDAAQQRALHACKTAQEQRLLLEQLRSTRWRRESRHPLDAVLDAEEREEEARRRSAAEAEQREQQRRERLARTYRSWVFRSTGEVLVRQQVQQPQRSARSGAATALSGAFVPCTVAELDFAVARSGRLAGGAQRLAEPTVPNPRSEAPLLSPSGGRDASPPPFVVRWAGFREMRQRASFVLVCPAGGVARTRLSLFSPRAELRSARHAGVSTRHGVAAWRAQVCVNGECHTTIVIRPQQQQQQQPQDADGEGDDDLDGSSAHRLARSLLLAGTVDLDLFHGDVVTLHLVKAPVALPQSASASALPPRSRSPAAYYDARLRDASEIRGEEMTLPAAPSACAAAAAAGVFAGDDFDLARGRRFDSNSGSSDSGAGEDDAAGGHLVRTPRRRGPSESRHVAAVLDDSALQNVWFLQFASRNG